MKYEGAAWRVMRSIALAFVAVALLGAGCAAPAAPAASSSAALQLDDGAANRVDVPVLPTAPPATGERTLAQAPTWRLGEWWTYRITDAFTGASVDTTLVVAGTFGTTYLVGFPIHDFSNNVLVLHMPGVGDVDRTDLSFEVHDVDFQMLRFPLVAGDSWTTAFEGRPGTVHVVRAQGEQAILQGSDTVQGTTGPTSSWNITATYDAPTGTITQLHAEGYADYKVTGHGFAYTGRVRVPHAHDLVFQHGRITPVLDINTQPTTTQTDNVLVEPGYDALAFTIIVGSGAVAPGPNAGYYQETVTSPNGTQYSLSSLPGEPGLKLAFYGTGDPSGTWTLQHTAGGPGLVLTEGIGYHSIDVDLPLGCVVQGPNSAHHPAPCRHDAAGNNV